jgi:hypothetical protein
LIDLAIKPFFCLIGFLLFSLLGVVSGVIGNGGVIGGIGVIGSAFALITIWLRLVMIQPLKVPCSTPQVKF